MPFGGGKYEEEADALMRATDAAAVCLIVIDGNKGHGFSVSGRVPDGAAAVADLPELLRAIARQVERALKAGP